MAHAPEHLSNLTVNQFRDYNLTGGRGGKGGNVGVIFEELKQKPLASRGDVRKPQRRGTVLGTV